MNTILGKNSHGGSSSGGGSGLSSLAGQFLGGGSHGNSEGKNSSGAGKLVGALASHVMSSSGKQEQPQTYHGGSHGGSSHGGLASSVMGGVSSFLGKHSGSGGSVRCCYVAML